MSRTTEIAGPVAARRREGGARGGGVDTRPLRTSQFALLLVLRRRSVALPVADLDNLRRWAWRDAGGSLMSDEKQPRSNYSLLSSPRATGRAPARQKSSSPTSRALSYADIGAAPGQARRIHLSRGRRWRRAREETPGRAGCARGSVLLKYR